MHIQLTCSYRRGTKLEQRNTRKASPQKLSQCKRVIGRYSSAKNANPHLVSDCGLANKRPVKKSNIRGVVPNKMPNAKQYFLGHENISVFENSSLFLS